MQLANQREVTTQTIRHTRHCQTAVNFRAEKHNLKGDRVTVSLASGQPTIVSIHFNLSSALTGTRPSFCFGLHICIGIVPANEVTEFLDRRVPWFVTILLSYLSDTMKAVVLRNL